jgi:hypothetical protein
MVLYKMIKENFESYIHGSVNVTNLYLPGTSHHATTFHAAIYTILMIGQEAEAIGWYAFSILGLYLHLSPSSSIVYARPSLANK